MNAFELLGFPPRPLLDAEKVQSRFLELSAPLHPDRAHALPDEEREKATRRFAELNAASRILRNPRDRLNLLLELETGKKPRDVQRIPPGTMELFSEVGQACRDADEFLASRTDANASPILRAAAKGRAAEWRRRLDATLIQVDEKAERARTDLAAFDVQWASGERHAALLDSIENLARLFSYIERWRSQLQDRLLELQVRG
ncbi:MAG: DnaJ domain-containing protein [Verrucomicrobiae bacterium]|nr:DnaJ domain-containing protein [Verrucomicrobiae bacterium]